MATKIGTLQADLRLESAAFIRDLRRTTQSVDRNTRAMRNDMNSMATSARAATTAFNTLRNSMVVFAGIDIARRMIQTADAMQQLENQLKLVTTSSSEFATVQEQLFEQAQETRTAFESTVSGFAALKRATEDVNVSNEQLLSINKAIAQSFIISGASAAEQAGAMRQLNQALASGVLRGEEFNSLAEQAPRLLKAMSDSLGVGIGQLREMAKQGELTRDVVIKAIQEQTGAIETEFGSMEQTVGQALTQLNNQWDQFVTAINKGTEASERLIQIINGLTTALATMQPALDKINILWNIFRVVTSASIPDAIALHDELVKLRSEAEAISNLPPLDPTKFLLPPEASENLKTQLENQTAAVNSWRTTVEVASQGTEQTFGSALTTMTGNLAQASSAFAQADEDFFQQNKAIQMANTVVNTASAVMKAWSQGGIFAAPIAATIAAIGAAQLAVIASAQPGSSRGVASGGGGGGGVSPASTAIAPQAGTSANITLVGDTFSQDQIRELFDQINSGLRDGYRINLVSSQ